MTRNDQLLILAGLIGVAAWLWLSRSGQSVARSAGSSVATGVQTVTEAIEKFFRGERNNNPGNIRISSNAWLGKVPVAQNTDGAFEQFTEAKYGIRALGKLLLNYQRNYGLKTVAQIINRWAPPSENDTGSYARAVAAALGVGVDSPVSLSNPETLFKMTKAIIRHENGRVIYDDARIHEGVSLALA